MGMMFANNAYSTLQASITSGATEIVVANADAGLFPSPAGANYFLLALADAAGNMEIVKCTSRTGNTLTVVRAQEGTAAFAFTAGTVVDLRITKGMLEKFTQVTGESLPPHHHDAQAGDIDNLTAALVGFAASGGIASTNVQAAIQELDTEKLSAADISGKANKAGDNMTGNHYWDNNSGIFYRNAAAAFTPGSAGAGLFKGADDTLYCDNYEGAFVMRLSGYSEALSIAGNGNMRIGGGGAAEAKLDVNGGLVVRSDHRLKAAAYPKMLFEATGNPSGDRKWQLYNGPTGILRVGHLNDAENAETPGTLSFDGALQVSASIGSAAHVLAGGAAVAWKTLAEMGMGRKIVAVGTGTGPITFATAEPDTTYSGFVMTIAPYTTAPQPTEITFGSIGSKTTTGCTINAGATPGTDVQTFYILWRN